MRDPVYSAEPELVHSLRFAAAAVMLVASWLVQRMVESHVVARLG